jgi:siroheme synthase-like protein
VDFPVNLVLSRRRCLVVGGGAVALRKARALLAAGADVTLVAPRIGRVPPGATARRRTFRDADLRAAFLVVVATDDESLNARVARACARRGVLVNVVDRPALCSVTFPATVRRGALTLAVSTGGESPAVAKAVRRELEALYPASIGRLVAMLGDARRRRPPGRDRMRFFARLVTPRLLAEARAGRLSRARAALR